MSSINIIETLGFWLLISVKSPLATNLVIYFFSSVQYLGHQTLSWKTLLNLRLKNS